MNIGKVFKDVLREFETAGLSSPSLDAEVLISHVLDIDRYKILTEPEREISEAELSEIKIFESRRLNFEPVAYITGHREFYSIDFKVNKNVLIPRPETELLVDMGIYWAKYGEALLDLCTGSGAVAVAIKKNRTDLDVSASDISEKALDVARENSFNALGKDKINFYEGNLFEPLVGEKYNVIVSNPPYVDPAELDNLQKDLTYEPQDALYCEDEGKSIIRKIIEQSSEYLFDNGVLILEIGHDQKDFVKKLGSEFGFGTTVLNDYSGLPRIATLRK